MQAIPLILARAIRPLVEFRDRLGAAAPPLPASVREDNALLPLTYGGLLWEETARAAGDPGLGLRVGLASRFEDSPIGFHIRNSPTVGAALAAAVRSGSLYNTGQRFSIELYGDEVRFHHHLTSALRRGRRQVADFSLTLIIDLLRRGAGPQLRPLALHLEGPAPAHAEQLAALAEGPVHFGAPCTALVFRRVVLALPLYPRPTSMAPTGNDRGLPASDFASSVRQTIRALLELGALDLRTAAEAAGTSARSFQRRLADAGLCFTQLADEARFEVATRLLRDPAARVIDVSVELGYTDAANFTRAFRRWAGVAPLEFRRVIQSTAG